VLIDEIDKAPRDDVPNDLLAEVENMRFFIPELDRAVAADPAMRPILVITSNSEKAVPDAFLRRCVYYHLPFPADDELREIVASRIAALPRDSDLVGDAIVFFGYVRHARQRLRTNRLRRRSRQGLCLWFERAGSEVLGALEWRKLSRIHFRSRAIFATSDPCQAR